MGRQIQVISENWHLGALAQNNTTQVNPRPVDYMDSVVTGAKKTLFLYKASQEEGGALFSPAKGTDPDIPAWAKCFLYCRRVKYLLPDAMGQDEFDVKYTLANGVQANLSNQINKNGAVKGKWMWQWDPNDPPKWADTGFDVTGLVDTEGENDFMYHATVSGTQWTLDALSCNGTQFQMKANPVPLKQTGWTSLKAHPQEQAQVMGAPGYTGKLYIATQIVVSDGPMKLQWY